MSIEKVRKFYVEVMQAVAGKGGWCYAKSKSRRGMCQSVSRWLDNIDENMPDLIERLREIQIENLDIIELIKKYDTSDTLFYLDTPYIHETRYENGNPIEYMVTTLTFSNGETVSVACEEAEANAYYGFYAAIAKKAAGGKNQINNLADYWINIKPARDKKKTEEEHKAEIEQYELEKRRAKKLKKKALKREAKRRAEAYKVAKLANELYSVPLDFKEGEE